MNRYKIIAECLTVSLITLPLCACGVNFNDNDANVGGSISLSNSQKFRNQRKYLKPEDPPKEEPPVVKKEPDKPVLDKEGHDIRSIEKISEEVIEGKYANGEDRKRLLGPRYQAVQDRVNEKCVTNHDPRCNAFMK